jgi:hypothetical protein
MPQVEPPPLEELDLPENYSRTDYLEHWSKPRDLHDPRLGGSFPVGATSQSFRSPADESLYTFLMQSMNPNYWSGFTTDGPPGTPSLMQHPGKRQPDMIRHLTREGLIPNVPAEWEHITNDINPDSDFDPSEYPRNYAAHYDFLGDPNTPEGFAPDPVYPPGIFPPEAGPPAGFGAGFPPMQPYGRADYLAHKGRPDRHNTMHAINPFYPIPGTQGGTWTNQGYEPNGIITEISKLGGIKTPAQWGHTSYLPPDPGQPNEILDEAEGFGTPEELYRHLLKSGAITRLDVPPPAFEDLDLNRGMEAPTQYLPYADYAYGFDQDDPYSNPMSGTPQPGQPQAGAFGPPQQLDPLTGYPVQSGQMQPQAQQPMAGMPSAPATNPASVNPPNGQQVMPQQPPAPSLDQTGRPLPQMYDEECMYGPSTPEEWEAEIAANPWDGTGHAAFADWLAEQPGMEEEAEIRRLFGGYITGNPNHQENGFDVSTLLDLFRRIYTDSKQRGWGGTAGGSSITGDTHYADAQPLGPAQEFDQPVGTYTYQGTPGQEGF